MKKIILNHKSYLKYDDVYRIETFCDLKKINKGFLVVITNNPAYLLSYETRWSR